jgi:hypothetical protein
MVVSVLFTGMSSNRPGAVGYGVSSVLPGGAVSAPQPVKESKRTRESKSETAFFIMSPVIYRQRCFDPP